MLNVNNYSYFFSKLNINVAMYLYKKVDRRNEKPQKHYTSTNVRNCHATRNEILPIFHNAHKLHAPSMYNTIVLNCCNINNIFLCEWRESRAKRR